MPMRGARRRRTRGSPKLSSPPAFAPRQIGSTCLLDWLRISCKRARHEIMASEIPHEGSVVPSRDTVDVRGGIDLALHFLAGGGEVGARLRSIDWSATPPGPAALWPQSLKTIVRVMLDSRYAMWMLWGPELTFFCNDAYLPTVGLKRDWVLGARSDRVWAEIWPDIGPRIEHVLAHGKATW